VARSIVSPGTALLTHHAVQSEVICISSPRPLEPPASLPSPIRVSGLSRSQQAIGLTVLFIFLATLVNGNRLTPPFFVYTVIGSARLFKHPLLWLCTETPRQAHDLRGGSRYSPFGPATVQRAVLPSDDPCAARYKIARAGRAVITAAGWNLWAGQSPLWSDTRDYGRVDLSADKRFTVSQSLVRARHGLLGHADHRVRATHRQRALAMVYSIRL